MKRRFALLTAGLMLATMPIPSAAAANDGLPDWIPNDYSSAVDFLNTYGATRADDGMIVISYVAHTEPDEAGADALYELRTDVSSTVIPMHRTFSSDDNRTQIHIFGYPPQEPGELNIRLVNAAQTSDAAPTDDEAEPADPDVKDNALELAAYSFSVDESMNITQTDIFGWLPDCAKEYNTYVNTYSEVSRKDNYIVFCLSNNAGTPFDWKCTSDGSDCFKMDRVSTCASYTVQPVDGGSLDFVHVYQAIADGTAKISYELAQVFGEADPVAELTADCTVLDDAQVILLPNEMRISLLDAETDEPIPLDEDAHPTISMLLEKETDGELSILQPVLEMTSNPCIFTGMSDFFASEYAPFYLSDDGLPAGYTLPAGSGDPNLNGNFLDKQIYDNSTADVAFRLVRRIQGNVNGDTRFSIVDAVLFMKWLTVDPASVLTDWRAADFNGDGMLTAADLSLMIRALQQSNPEPVVAVLPDAIPRYPARYFAVSGSLKIYAGPDESYACIGELPEHAMFYENGWKEGNGAWVYTESGTVSGWIRIRSDDGMEWYAESGDVVDKPVIYLYPEQATDVHIELELTESELSTTYPRYNDGWDVTAYPDGTLLNHADGTHHRSLFWDSVNCRTHFDFSKGFCVAGNDTEQFLKEKLTLMGLNENEMNEFLVYWLPRMEHNAYNYISFQTDAYTDSAKLSITPAPDSICRVFMAYVPLEQAVEAEPQTLSTFERTGFAVVEWGGCEVRTAAQ